MGAQAILVLVQNIQSPVKPAVIDLVEGHAQQILQRAVDIPPFGHFQFTALATETGHCQDAGRQFPRDFFPARFDYLLEQLMQSQAPPQRQRQIDLTELSDPLDANPAQIYLRPLGRSFLPRLAQLALNGSGCSAFQQIGQLVPAVSRFAIQSGGLA
jgi:hypothetical protein